MLILEELFCSLDDFGHSLEADGKKQLIPSGSRCRLGRRRLSRSEMRTILISIHHSTLVTAGNKNGYWRPRLGAATGIGFIDSTSLQVGHHRRISSHRHRVLDGVAKRGRTSVDWFYGFK